MRTGDPKVFAAGDGAFGGSTIVMAMHHGQRGAYYIKAFLDGNEEPLPYRTPFRTRRVPVAQDLKWELLPRHEQEFHGLGAEPVAFPEIESTYELEVAKAEAARCYRCDAETGSADYSVHHREDLFSMARTNPLDHQKLRAMLDRRLKLRENPFPEGRPASFDDLVFLPANLSRLVIDPYREACRVDVRLADRLDLPQPFFVTGFDEAPEAVRAAVDRGLAKNGCGYIGRQPVGSEAAWLQLLDAGEEPGDGAADGNAVAVIRALGTTFRPLEPARAREGQLAGLAVSSAAVLEEAVPHALDSGFDFLLLDGTGGLGRPWPELTSAPDFSILRDAVAVLRRLRREEEIQLVWFGGARSGTDAAKLIAMGATAAVYGMAVALAVGGRIDGKSRIEFAADYTDDDRAGAVSNLLAAHAGEASMMARCTGKTAIQNLEPEDLRALTLATATATGIPLVGKH